MNRHTLSILVLSVLGAIGAVAQTFTPLPAGGGGAAFSGGEITQCLVVNDSTGADLEICEDAVTYDDAADQTLRLGNDGAGGFTLQIDGDVLFPNSGTISPYKFTTPGSDVFWFQTSNASATPSYRFITGQTGGLNRTLALFATSWNDQFAPNQYIRTGYNFNTSTGTYTEGAFAATPAGIINLGALNGGDLQVNDNLRTTTGIVTSTVAASGSAVAHTLDTTTDYGSGDTLLSVKDNGGEVLKVEHNGRTVASGSVEATSLKATQTFTSGTRATCDAAAVGSQIMYDDGVDQISLCVCEQTGSGTFAWGAATSTGDCT